MCPKKISKPFDPEICKEISEARSCCLGQKMWTRAAADLKIKLHRPEKKAPSKSMAKVVLMGLKVWV